jgi:TatD DNase family protein
MKSQPLIDIGVNLTNKRFNSDLTTVIDSAKEVGVNHLIITGTSITESKQAIELCQQFPDFCSATAGIHPHDADQAPDDFIEQLTDLANHQCVRAIGECGLDFNRNFSTPDNQQKVFEQQLELAAKLALPVFLHQRDAFDCWQGILSNYLTELPGGVSHCFTGDLTQLKKCLDMGLYIGITGWICDPKRGQELFDIAKYIPLDRIMIETDAPYLVPKSIRPKPKSSRNEPKYLPAVLEHLALAMSVPIDTLAEHTRANSINFFALDNGHGK